MLKNLKKIRENKELTQQEIANFLGVKQQTYSMWENGDRIIPLKHLNSLCSYYNTSMNYLCDLNDFQSNNYKKDNLDSLIIGNRLKQFREKNNISQRQLAKELNTTHSTISAYEAGKTMLLTGFAFQICKNHKISMDWLCGRED